MDAGRADPRCAGTASTPAADPQGRAPKTIVLMADGTGQAADKGRGSNVWALYEALDRAPSDGTTLCAIYDDGVGTTGVLSRVLGRAFGFGFKDSVTRLYEALVNCYEFGDHVYLFGFSRGAYVVRVLADLLDRCGVLSRTATSKASPTAEAVPFELDAWARRHAILEVWRTYKRLGLGEAESSDRVDIPTRGLTELSFHRPRGSETDPPGRRHLVQFLGVWDTVDAIGLPFQGMRDGLRRLRRERFRVETVPGCVRQARQALALDDERRTFWPEVWREGSAPADRDRVRQVWFAGVHSSTGGGYEKDQMALVSLEWMLQAAVRLGLPVRESFLRDLSSRADPLGHMHDSRSGPAVFFRPGARDVAAIMGSGQRVLVHGSVLRRVEYSLLGYEPVWLPPEFTVEDGFAPGDQGNWHIDVDVASRGAGRRISERVFPVLALVVLQVACWSVFAIPRSEVSAPGFGIEVELPSFPVLLLGLTLPALSAELERTRTSKKKPVRDRIAMARGRFAWTWAAHCVLLLYTMSAACLVWMIHDGWLAWDGPIPCGALLGGFVAALSSSGLFGGRARHRFTPETMRDWLREERARRASAP